ncbi:MAG: tetratricopeptide repeat protein [Candidatus Omnitrophica bacterium]|nr:tetratricopeptide repeat protein [Candidatus Omnitrophota bacterium]
MAQDVLKEPVSKHTESKAYTVLGKVALSRQDESTAKQMYQKAQFRAYQSNDMQLFKDMTKTLAKIDSNNQVLSNVELLEEKITEKKTTFVEIAPLIDNLAKGLSSLAGMDEHKYKELGQKHGNIQLAYKMMLGQGQDMANHFTGMVDALNKEISSKDTDEGKVEKAVTKLRAIMTEFTGTKEITDVTKVTVTEGKQLKIGESKQVVKEDGFMANMSDQKRTETRFKLADAALVCADYYDRTHQAEKKQEMENKAEQMAQDVLKEPVSKHTESKAYTVLGKVALSRQDESTAKQMYQNAQFRAYQSNDMQLFKDMTKTLAKIDNNTQVVDIITNLEALAKQTGGKETALFIDKLEEDGSLNELSEGISRLSGMNKTVFKDLLQEGRGIELAYKLTGLQDRDNIEHYETIISVYKTRLKTAFGKDDQSGISENILLIEKKLDKLAGLMNVSGGLQSVVKTLNIAQDYMSLADFSEKIENSSKQKELLSKAETNASLVLKNARPSDTNIKSQAQMVLAEMYAARNDLYSAKEHNMKAASLILDKESISTEDIKLYNTVAIQLAEIGFTEDAENNLNKASAVLNTKSSETVETQKLQLLDGYSGLAEIYKDNGNKSKSREVSRKVQTEYKNLLKPEVKNIQLKIIAHKKLGDINKTENNIYTAREHYAKAKALVQQKNETIYLRSEAKYKGISLDKMNTLMETPKNAEAQEIISAAHQFAENINDIEMTIIMNESTEWGFESPVISKLALGAVSLRNNNFEQAETSFAEVYNLTANVSELSKLKEHAIELIEQASVRKEEAKVVGFYNQGIGHYKNNRFDFAIKSFEQVIDAGKNNPRLTKPKLVGLAYVGLGDACNNKAIQISGAEERKALFSQAKENYNAALKINPDNIEARHGLGLVLSNQGKFEQDVNLLKNVPTISYDNIGYEPQANVTIAKNMDKRAFEKGDIGLVEYFSRFNKLDKTETKIADDFDIKPDYKINGCDVFIIDAPDGFLSKVGQDEQHVSAGLRRGAETGSVVVYISRAKFNEMNDAELRKVVAHEKSEVTYLRKEAEHRAWTLDTMSSFLKTPENTEAQKMISAAHQFAGKIEDITQGVELPSAVIDKLAVGVVSLRNDDLDKAEASFTEVYELTADIPGLSKLKGYTIELMEQTTLRKEYVQVFTSYQQGISHYQQGVFDSAPESFDLAIESFNQVIEAAEGKPRLNKLVAKALVGLGMVYMRKYNFEKAEDVFEKASGKASEYTELKELVGNTNLLKESAAKMQLVSKIEKAVASLSAGINAFDDAFEKKSNYKEAITQFSEIAHMESENINLKKIYTSAQFNLALSYLQAGEKDKAKIEIGEFIKRVKKDNLFNESTQLAKAYSVAIQIEGRLKSEGVINALLSPEARDNTIAEVVYVNAKGEIAAAQLNGRFDAENNNLVLTNVDSKDGREIVIEVKGKAAQDTLNNVIAKTGKRLEGNNALLANESGIVEKINAAVKGKEIYALGISLDSVMGFANREKEVFIAESLLNHKDPEVQEIAVFLESGKAYFAKEENKLPEDILSSSTYLSGCGKEVRNAAAKIENISGIKNEQEFIEAINNQLPEERILSFSETALIRYNWEKGEKSILGLMDRLFGKEANEKFTQAIKDISAAQKPEITAEDVFETPSEKIQSLRIEKIELSIGEETAIALNRLFTNDLKSTAAKIDNMLKTNEAFGKTEYML